MSVNPIAGVLLGLAAFYPVAGFLTMAWVIYRSQRMLASAKGSAHLRG